jgi:uncharacterized membrane protein
MRSTSCSNPVRTDGQDREDDVTNVDADPKAELVRGYLERLRAAASGLPPDRREELLAEVREHIGAAMTAGPGEPTEVSVRNVLERLGPPEEIVRAERDDPAPPPTHHVAATAETATSPWGALEVAALVTLAAGGIVLPVLGLLIGLLLAWLSDRWTTQQKLVASAIALLPIILVLPLALAGPGLT